MPALVGVRDPFCYALWMLSLPVVDSLMLGNASLLIALGCALVWRYRDRPTAAAIAAAGVVVLKFWIWPLLVWLLITRPRSGIRAVAIAGSATIVAWAVIGFRGLTAYPGLMHTEAQRFARIGVLFVASLIQLDVPIKLAAAAGVVAGVALLGAAYSRRANDLDSFALALLAALVATPVAWPHYLVLPALTLMIARPALSLAWAWFPALWFAFDLAQQHGLAGQPLALSLFAVRVLVSVSHRLRGSSWLTPADGTAPKPRGSTKREPRNLGLDSPQRGAGLSCVVGAGGFEPP